LLTWLTSSAAGGTFAVIVIQINTSAIALILEFPTIDWKPFDEASDENTNSHG
jgi:hypothetical protein